MNSCHVCTSIPKKDQIIACDNCEHNYCLKCIKIHLNEPSIQKLLLSYTGLSSFATLIPLNKKKPPKAGFASAVASNAFVFHAKVQAWSVLKSSYLEKNNPPLLKENLKISNNTKHKSSFSKI
jgi:hypothetical protein